MAEHKSFTMKEMSERKFKLPFDEIFSFQQLYNLKEVKQRVSELWKDHKELFDYLEKARMFALLIDREEKWEEWWKANKFSIGFKVINEFFEKKLKYRECAFCGNPFSEGKTTKKYCSHNCRIYARRKEQRQKRVTT